jgi:hypothetical protein
MKRHMTRDMIVKLIEVDDQRFKELDEKGWDSALGKSFDHKDPNEQLQIYRTHTSEAKWRNTRAEYYARGKALVQNGTMTEAGFKEDMEQFDEARAHSESDTYAEEDNNSDGDDKRSDVASRGSTAVAPVALSNTAVVANIKGKNDGDDNGKYSLMHTERHEARQSADDGHEKYHLTAAEKQEIRLQFENTLRQLARDSTVQPTSQPGKKKVNGHEKTIQAKEPDAEASYVKTSSKRKRKGKGKGKSKERVTETPTPLPPINPAPGLQEKCQDCPGCRAKAQADAIRAQARRTFHLPEDVPFQDNLGKMTGDMTESQIKSLEMFMKKLSVKPEEKHVSEKRAAGGYDKLTEVQRHKRVGDRGEQGLVKQLLMCSVDEYVAHSDLDARGYVRETIKLTANRRERHKRLIDKHWIMTGGKTSDREPVGGRENAIQRLQLAFPSIKTQKRAIEEIAIAGGNPELAFAFAQFREEYLDNQFGKIREPYDEDEAFRFAAAVRYNLDLDRVWAGPESKSEEDDAKEAEAKAKEEAEVKAKEEAETKAKESKCKQIKGKGKGRKK